MKEEDISVKGKNGLDLVPTAPWEPIQECAAFRDAARHPLHSHAGAWKREKPIEIDQSPVSSLLSNIKPMHIVDARHCAKY